MTYDVDYFIKKFEAIPDREWCIKYYYNDKNQFCALGFCGEGLGGETDESLALKKIFINHRSDLSPGNVNDGLVKLYQQPTPRARILAALRDAKKRIE